MDLLLHALANTPDFAVPFALAALGLILTERSGVLSLGAEGFMLVGALVGIGAMLRFGDPLVAMVLAMLASAGVSLLFAVMVVWLRVNQVIAGLALVFFCQGFTSLLGTLLEWTNRTTTGLPGLWGQNAVVWLTPLLFIAVTLFLNASTLGLRWRAVGENPQAADAAGIPVTAYRFVAVMAGAAIVGLAGAYISVVSTKLWIAGMTGGRGWIAVGLVIFSRWSPWKALGGALLFGGIEALIPQLAAGGVRLPQYFLLMTPYVVTLAVMVWVVVSGRNRQGAGAMPGALGEPYVREERR
jgi:ABC-type uncharacterized transport system permease subunit